MGDIVARPVAEINRVIRNYQNGDVKFDLSSPNKVFEKFHKLFGMSYWSGSRYVKIKNGNDLVALRISDHRAVGTYFKQADSECSRYLSMFIGEESDHKQTPIAYTEIRYKPESFKANSKSVVDSMFSSIQKFLNNDDIAIDESLGVKTDYRKEI